MKTSMWSVTLWIKVGQSAQQLTVPVSETNEDAAHNYAATIARTRAVEETRPEIVREIDRLVSANLYRRAVDYFNKVMEQTGRNRSSIEVELLEYFEGRPIAHENQRHSGMSGRLAG